MELLERFSTSDHVNNVDPNLDDYLLWNNNPKAELLPEGMLAELMVAIKTLSWHHLMHFNHLPQGIQGDDP